MPEGDMALWADRLLTKYGIWWPVDESDEDQDFNTEEEHYDYGY